MNWQKHAIQYFARFSPFSRYSVIFHCLAVQKLRAALVETADFLSACRVEGAKNNNRWVSTQKHQILPKPYRWRDSGAVCSKTDCRFGAEEVHTQLTNYLPIGIRQWESHRCNSRSKPFDTSVLHKSVTMPTSYVSAWLLGTMPTKNPTRTAIFRPSHSSMH